MIVSFVHALPVVAAPCGEMLARAGVENAEKPNPASLVSLKHPLCSCRDGAPYPVYPDPIIIHRQLIVVQFNDFDDG